MIRAAFRNFFSLLLALLARAIIKKYRPQIVMVTGSVGKTSTKDAVAAVLSEKFFLRASEKSYNSEIGVPLTIFGSKNPWSNMLVWLRVFEEALALIIFPNHYPKLLVLEVGADRPGDLARILKIATPDAVVVTHLPEVPVHVEAYASPQAVRDEEFTPAYALPPDAPLIVSADDGHSREMAEKLEARVLTFGFDEDADVRVEHPTLYEEDGEPSGMQADFVYLKKKHRVVVHGALGKAQLLAPAAAFALAASLGLSLSEIQEGLSRYVPPPGRNRMLHGLNGSLIIDDSYNASPAAMRESLSGLCLLAREKRRIAVLGDMLELGRYSSEEHERIGKLVVSCADVLVTVGIRARAIGAAARHEGMKEENIFSYASAHEAAKHLKDIIGKDDAVLIKGSQSIRTERIVSELLAHPEDKKKLVRQEREWQLIK